jgi:dephospho-CoA kinase
MMLIGLTGGIGAGKSTIAKRFAELGAHVVDADVMARRAVDPGTAALTAIENRFGRDVISADGSLNRPALGAIVFSDDNARTDLESIVHPAVHALTSAEFERIKHDIPDAVIVYDVPLLVEAKNRYEFDRVIVAHAPAEKRIQRLVSLRGMSEEEARKRVAAQASDGERLHVADDVVDTGGTLEHTIEQVDAIWASLRQSHA